MVVRFAFGIDWVSFGALSLDFGLLCLVVGLRVLGVGLVPRESGRFLLSLNP